MKLLSTKTNKNDTIISEKKIKKRKALTKASTCLLLYFNSQLNYNMKHVSLSRFKGDFLCFKINVNQINIVYILS